VRQGEPRCILHMASNDRNHRIQPLPPEAIAAMVTGPVIQDLASCVKELVENAIDAGAQQINSTCDSLECLWIVG
jgi:DNA mismatch repair ATPase MutL